jgi:D-alanyl-D-alanine dipeptidase
MNILKKLFGHGFDPARPIGELGSVEGWKSLSIRACDEPLVPLGSFSDYPEIATSSIYRGERVDSPYPLAQVHGSLFTVFVRLGVAKKLAKAARLLPAGHMLLVWDAFRPLNVQQSLFDDYVKKLETAGTPHEQAVVDAQKFVSIPSHDATRPPPHNTGGAVDLTIIRFSTDAWKEMQTLNRVVRMKETKANWRQIYAAEMRRIQLVRESSSPLDMGTVFDEVAPTTATRYYEGLNSGTIGEVERQRRDNRRLLCNLLTIVGFSNYPEEWWHFDFGNQFDAARTGRKSIYGPANLSDGNWEHEKIRSGHYNGCLAINEGNVPDQSLTKFRPDPVFKFVQKVSEQTGNIRQTGHPIASCL